jgi:hypothetical protein
VVPFNLAPNLLTRVQFFQVHPRLAVTKLCLAIDQQQHVPGRLGFRIERIYLDGSVDDIDLREHALQREDIRLIMRVRPERRGHEGHQGARVPYQLRHLAAFHRSLLGIARIRSTQYLDIGDYAWKYPTS